jgi:predicted small metal-binding protein
MAYSLNCGDIVDGCQTKLSGASEADVLQQAAQHAADDHGIAEIDDDTLAKVKGAIRSS